MEISGFFFFFFLDFCPYCSCWLIPHEHKVPCRLTRLPEGNLFFFFFFCKWYAYVKGKLSSDYHTNYSNVQLDTGIVTIIVPLNQRRPIKNANCNNTEILSVWRFPKVWKTKPYAPCFQLITLKQLLTILFSMQN